MSTRRRTIIVTAALLFTAGCTTATAGSAVTPVDRVVLVTVPGGVAASSTRHGPFHDTGDRASGFSHDEVGATLAAAHIGPRVTPRAGRDIFSVTLAEQCWGDVDTVRRWLLTAFPLSDARPRDELTPTAMHFRVIGGDPRGSQVVVSLLVDTPQSRELGGFARIDATLRWSGQDWQLKVPVGRPTAHPDTDDYRLLGPTS